MFPLFSNFCTTIFTTSILSKGCFVTQPYTLRDCLLNKLDISSMTFSFFRMIHFKNPFRTNRSTVTAILAVFILIVFIFLGKCFCIHVATCMLSNSLIKIRSTYTRYLYQILVSWSRIQVSGSKDFNHIGQNNKLVLVPHY